MIKWLTVKEGEVYNILKRLFRRISSCLDTEITCYATKDVRQYYKLSLLRFDSFITVYHFFINYGQEKELL